MMMATSALEDFDSGMAAVHQFPTTCRIVKGFFCRAAGGSNVGHPKWLLQIVDVDQAHAGGLILSAHDGGVVAGRQSREDRRFLVVRRRYSSRFDGCRIGVLLIVIESHDSCNFEIRNSKQTRIIKMAE